MTNLKILLLLTCLFVSREVTAQTDSTLKISQKDTLVSKKSGYGTTDSLVQHMLNEPAPLFTLTDLKGKTVSLKDFRGKIVIVDFWATWCPPCKASMPAYQRVVKQDKKRTDVQFLFIDCGERAANYKDLVKKFVKDNHYKLPVLFDEKGNDGQQTQVLNAYKIDGIPTKFIIDKQGNIRFKSVGYSGNPETFAGELNTMIDLVEKANQ